MPKVQKVATKVVPNNKLSVQYLQTIYIQNNLQKKSCWDDNLQNLNKNDPYWQFPERLERQFVTFEKNDPSS